MNAELDQAALDAACAVLPRAVSRNTVRRALEAVGKLYADADQTAVDAMVAETGLLGMEPTSSGVAVRIRHSERLAAGMVQAFDEHMMANGCENYTETEMSVTDPARAKAIAAGLPYDQIPPLRTYRFIIVKPGGRSPHELRRDAEGRLAAVTTDLKTILDRTLRLNPGPCAKCSTTQDTLGTSICRHVAQAGDTIGEELHIYTTTGPDGIEHQDCGDRTCLLKAICQGCWENLYDGTTPVGSWWPV